MMVQDKEPQTALEIMTSIKKLAEMTLEKFEGFLAEETLRTLNQGDEEHWSLGDMFDIITGAAMSGKEAVEDGRWEPRKGDKGC